MVASPWGSNVAQHLVDYHVRNGGISRHAKLAYFIDTILPKYYNESEISAMNVSINSLINNYSSIVREALLTCPVTENLKLLRNKLPNAKWSIVSGGDQHELREIFQHRGISSLFNGGIFGSPDTKEEIFKREISSGHIQLPALYLGDSKYDYTSSRKFGIDFIFVSKWSEVKDWDKWVLVESLHCIESVSDLLNHD